MIATTIEQSRHLFELGLDPMTADMFWKYSASLGNKDINGRIAVSYHDNLFVGKYDGAIPAWSLTALLEVMPSFIEYKGQKLRLTLEKAGIWNVFYIGTEHRLNEIWFNGEYNEPIEASYKMVCWLLENGYIKKGGES